MIDDEMGGTMLQIKDGYVIYDDASIASATPSELDGEVEQVRQHLVASEKRNDILGKKQISLEHEVHRLRQALCVAEAERRDADENLIREKAWLDGLMARNTELRKALDRYGMHEPGCRSCTCGLAEVTNG